MADEPAHKGLASRIFNGFLIAVAFVAVSMLFTMMLRPLAQPRQGAQVAAAREIALPEAALAARQPEARPGFSEATIPAPAGPLKPAALPEGPKIAILVTELGGDEARGNNAIDKLPAVFGLAFLPGQKASRPLARKAAAAGHEIWIGLPMQPKGWPRISPGPNTLLVDAPPTENAKRVEWALAQVDRPAGAYTMMGSAFTASAAAMAPVADAIRRHDIVLLDARSIGATVAAKSVRAAGGKALSNDMFIDGEPTRKAISAALDRLVRQARANGEAIGIARGLPVTLDMLPAWAATLEEKGVTLVPPARLAS